MLTKKYPHRENPPLGSIFAKPMTFLIEGPVCLLETKSPLTPGMIIGLGGDSSMKPSKTKNSNLIRWKPPPLDFFTLNTNGFACSNPSKAATRGLIRDYRGAWIGSRIMGTPRWTYPCKQPQIHKLHIELTSHCTLIDDSHPCSALISG
uniref:Uncharacterized protein n=1 Tax=Quercus lobata TaxID=97700 RepID=A0A7N2N2F9_QUELO